jgi:hypothetical protein
MIDKKVKTLWFNLKTDRHRNLDLGKYKNGVGNRITRLLFDTSILLYVDRFSPTERPSKSDIEMLEQFVVFAFIWSYSLRAQYKNLGWQSAQNYITSDLEKINSFNMYKVIAEADSPISLLSELSDKINPLPIEKIEAKKEEMELCINGIYQNYLHFFNINKYIAG